jgi:dTDP-4-amino-4,6-dideoxygalactose transaminase
MREKNIPVSVVHQSITRYSVFNDDNLNLINQKKFDNDQISIPIHADLTSEDIDKVVQAIKIGW